MKIPTKEQAIAAQAAVKRMHEHLGYRRPLRDYYSEAIVWAVIGALMVNDATGQLPPEKSEG